MRIRPFLLLGLAAAVALVAWAPASAAPAHTAKLSPPVIHESFTPLPCSGAPGHRSTLQMEGCAEEQILASDKKIDALNQEIFGKLFDAAARRRFIAGHNAWFAYRRAYCLSASDVFEGGTEAAVVDADCTASVNSQHVMNLKGFLADFGPHTG
jgi:uncharacterized protein YecT (DUF1311 family)